MKKIHGCTLYSEHFKHNNDDKSGKRPGGDEEVKGKGWVLSGRVDTEGNIYY